MPNPLTIPDIRPGQPMRAADMQPLLQAVRRQSLQPGQFQSGALLVQRPVPLGGDGKGGFNTGFGTVDLQMCLICGTVPAATVTVQMTEGAISALGRAPGVSTGEVVYPMIVDDSGNDGGVYDEPPSFINETYPEGHDQEGEIVKMIGANYAEEYPIRGGDAQEVMDGESGTGEYNDPPIWGIGFKAEKAGEPDPEDPEAEPEPVPFFVILMVVDEIEWVRGLTTAAVETDDTELDADNIEQLSGPRLPNRSKVSGVEIPYPVDSDDNAYCLFVRDKVTGNYLLVDLACPSEA